MCVRIGLLVLIRYGLRKPRANREFYIWQDVEKASNVVILSPPRRTKNLSS